MKKMSDVSKGSGEPIFFLPVSANRRHVESQFVRRPPLNDFVFLFWDCHDRFNCCFCIVFSPGYEERSLLRGCDLNNNVWCCIMLFAFDLKPLNSYQILTSASKTRSRMVVTDLRMCWLLFVHFFSPFIFHSVLLSIIFIPACLFCLLWMRIYNCIVVVNRQRHKLILCDENRSAGERAS